MGRTYDAMTDNLEDTIRENAEGPAEAHGDSGGMKQHDLSKLIEADRYLESKKAARSKNQGIRLSKLIPPGTT